MRVAINALIVKRWDDGGRASHLALSNLPKTRFNNPQGTSQVALNARYSQGRAMSCLTMAPDHNPGILPLFHCTCPLQVAEPTERTSTGRHCWIVCCLDSGNGYHHSQTIICNSTPVLQHFDSSVQNSHVYSPSAYPDSFSAPLSTMVRHSMLSRRDGTRGGNSRSEARHRSISDSLTSVAENPHYPNTRSGWGRAGLHCSGRNEAAVRTAPFPLPLHQVPHTMKFQYCSSLNYPVIIATISISITKEAEQNISMTISMEETHRAGPSRNRGNDEE